MASNWKPPKGYTLTVIPGHYIDETGINTEGSRKQRTLMADGVLEVAHWDEDEPFVWGENDGTGQFASQEAKDAAEAGEPMAGWNPNVTLKPIEGGWVPDQYVLRAKDDPTPVTEPASVTTPEEPSA